MSMRLGLILAVIGFIAFGRVSDAQADVSLLDCDISQSGDCLAAALLVGIPNGYKIALRPFPPSESGLPASIGEQIYDDIILGLSRRASGRFEIIGSESLDEIWDIWREDFIGDFEAFIENQRADAQILCDISPNSGGYQFDCTAVRIDPTQATVELSIGREIFPEVRVVYTLDYGLSELARRLSNVAEPPKPLHGILMIDNRTGRNTTLTEYLAGRLRNHMDDRLLEAIQRHEGQIVASQVLQSGETAPVETGSLSARVTLWWPDDETVTLGAVLFDGDRRVGEEWVDLRRDSLPQALTRPSTSSRYAAEASATLSAALDAESAERAARNLARARVIAQALQQPAPPVDTIETEANGVQVLLGHLDHAVTVNERFSAPRISGETMTLELSAEVIPVGGRLRPAVEASLAKSVVAAGEPIEISITSDTAAYVALFSWGADNRIVRIYPNQTTPNLGMRMSDVMQLPIPGEGLIRSAPMPFPGNRSDHEALIVLASADAVDYQALAPLAADTLQGSINVAVPAGEFLAELAEMDIARMSMIVLPYQVSAP